MECGLGGQSTRLRIFIPDTGEYSSRVTLPRRAWVRLNCLRIGVVRFYSCLYKWRMALSPACECGAEEQTVEHVVLQCPIHWHPHVGYCTAWHFWTMRQSNGCSTSVRDLVRPSSLVVRRTSSKDEEVWFCLDPHMQNHVLVLWSACFSSWGKCTAGAILTLAKHDWLKVK